MEIPLKLGSFLRTFIPFRSLLKFFITNVVVNLLFNFPSDISL